jgi:dsDNA-specific endonuclease/ATPase MutS2
MGLALAAELNGYPGPSHVLELADQLGLSPDQRRKVQEMFSKMKADTTPIGNKLIEQESDLDRQFSHRTITAASLETATSAISKTQGELREAHLNYHLLTAAILDQTQLAKYAELRGYASDAPVPQRGHHH